MRRPTARLRGLACPALISCLCLCISARAAEFQLSIVEAESGKPIGQARVRTKIDGALTSHYSDRDGRCAIPLPKSGLQSELTATVSARDRVPVLLRWGSSSQSSLPPLPDTYTLELEKGTSIGGFVEDETGNPIRGATVRLYVEPKTQTNPMVAISDLELQTDADGHWRCDILPPELERLRITVDLSGRLAQKTFSYGGTSQRSIAALRNESDILTIEQRYTIEGTIFGPDGKPVAGASITAWNSEFGPEQGLRANSDRNGAFIIRNCKSTLHAVLVEASGCAPQVALIAVGPRAPAERIELAPGRVLQGRVLDGAGGPVADAIVEARSWFGIPALQWRTLTDADGRFEWNGAPDGSVQIRVRKAGFQTAEEVTLAASAAEHELTLAARLLVQGTVVDATTGAPVPEFRVRVGVELREEGGIEWIWSQPAPFQDGRYAQAVDESYSRVKIAIEADGYLPVVSPVYANDAGAQQFAAQLEPGANLAATIVRPDGQPAAAVEVVLYTAMPGLVVQNGLASNGADNLTALTDANGWVSFPPQLEACALAVLTEAGFLLLSDAELAEQSTHTLEPYARVEGSVLCEGQSGAGRTVVLQYDETGAPDEPRLYQDYRTASDESGRFVFPRAMPGRARLGVVSESAGFILPDENALDIVAGEDVRADVRVDSREISGSIELAGAASSDTASAGIDYSRGAHRLMRASGNGADASDGGALEQVASIDVGADGRFVLRDVPTGNYVLSFTLIDELGDRLASADQPIEVAAGAGTIDIGKVLLQPVERLVAGAGAPPIEATTLDGGQFRLADYAGKIVLLDFWAAWCGPCRGETPHLKAVYDEFGDDERFVMVGLSLDPDAKDAQAYVDENKMEWIQAHLGEWSQTSIPDTYDVHGIPAIMLIGADGRLLNQGLRGEAIREAVAAALGDAIGAES